MARLEPPGITLEVPDVLTEDEATAARAIIAEALEIEVGPSSYVRSVGSGEVNVALQFALWISGNIAIGLFGNAAWTGAQQMYRMLRDRFPNRPISVELRVQDDSGHVAEYPFANLSDDALRAISADLARGARGTRVAYDVDQGWLTYEEFQEKKYGKRQG